MKLQLVLATALGVAAAREYPRGYIRSSRRGNITQLQVLSVSAQEVASAPDSIDWSKNATTAVRDQGHCGSCWAMSTIEAIESGLFMTTGKLPEKLSTEQLVSCDTLFDDGCKGGDPYNAYQYLTGFVDGGVASAADYPDKSSASGKTGSCTWNKETVVTVTDFKYGIPNCEASDCKKQDEGALAAALVKYGPMSICINSGYQQTGDWAKYTGGVLSGSCEGSYGLIDHCVQLVGYDKTASTPYWKIRNSWGTDWGENGYIRIPYGKQNYCCVGCEASVFTSHIN